MIIELYVTLIAISFILIALGFSVQIEYAWILKTLGFGLLIAISLDTTITGISYESGANITNSGTYINVASYYTNYDFRTMSILFLFVGVIGCFVLPALDYNQKQKIKKSNDDGWNNNFE